MQSVCRAGMELTMLDDAMERLGLRSGQQVDEEMFWRCIATNSAVAGEQIASLAAERGYPKLQERAESLSDEAVHQLAAMSSGSGAFPDC